jgi:Reverse transcriptase (RNA-dependent DNA polymerase)
VNFFKAVTNKFRRRVCSSEAYSTANQYYRQLLESKKADYKLELTKKLSNHRNPVEFWKVIKSINAKTRKTIPISKDMWENHYSTLFEQSEVTYLPISEKWEATADTDDSSFDPPISMDEVNNCIQKLKKKKAPGLDGFPNETWTFSTQLVRKYLCTLFQLCFISGTVPLDWCKVIIAPIHKKGSSLLTTNYRPIALVQTIAKLFTTILAKRLLQWMKQNEKISDYQAGFKPQSGCEDHIFVLNSLIQSRFAKKSKRTLASLICRRLLTLSHMIGSGVN